jgi:hypothetical protein
MKSFAHAADDRQAQIAAEISHARILCTLGHFKEALDILAGFPTVN